MNGRPRKKLGYRTPEELFDEFLDSVYAAEGCGSVEETLNELLEKEAESLTQAARYERSEARQGYRSGHYGRNLTTTSGDVTLHVPRFKGVPFETAIIERYRRRESNVSSKPRMNIELRRATMCGNTPKSFSCRSCL